MTTHAVMALAELVWADVFLFVVVARMGYKLSTTESPPPKAYKRKQSGDRVRIMIGERSFKVLECQVVQPQELFRAEKLVLQSYGFKMATHNVIGTLSMFPCYLLVFVKMSSGLGSLVVGTFLMGGLSSP